MKKAIQTAMDMARRESRYAVPAGSGESDSWPGWRLPRRAGCPWHTLRANIDYGFAEAQTLYGQTGHQVLGLQGETKNEKKVPEATPINILRLQ